MTEAEAHNERGRVLSAEGDPDGAIEAYRRAIAAAPQWSVPWYNLGLVHKYRLEWEPSAECNRTAVVLDDTDEGAWWNLGIAATATGDWPAAREAWGRCGVTVDPGHGPIEMNLGLTPIRLDPQGRGEVVWCDRIDPCRAVIRNIPLPGSGHRFGDLVLHDGAVSGYRKREGREVPVFDALQLLRRSRFRTFLLDIPGSSDRERGLLVDVAFELGRAAEDWSRTVSILCRRCSEGRPHERHDRELEASRPELAVAVAAAESAEDLERVIGRWRERSGYTGYVGYAPAEDDG